MTISAVDVKYDKFPKDFLLEFFRNDYHNISDYDIPEDLKESQPDLGKGADVIQGFKVDCHNYFNNQLRPVGEEFCKHFGITNQFVTHFLCIEPGYTVDWHQDGGDVVCAVNLLLEGNPCPVDFEDGSHLYELALLNVQKRHRIINYSDKQRILFRLSFMDGTYEEIKNRCLK